MALYALPRTALAESDADGTNGSNIVANAVITVTDLDGGTVVMYDDADGTGGATSKLTNSKGQKDVYLPSGEYIISINGVNPQRVTVGDHKELTVTGLANSGRKWQVGEIINTIGYSTPGDYGSTCWVKTAETGVASQLPTARGDGTLTDSSGSVWRVISGSVSFDVVFSVPTQFSSLQIAVDAFYPAIKPVGGAALSINIEAGHQPESGISVSNGDYSFIRITSDDAEVTVSTSWFGGGFLVCENAVAPTLATIINLNHLATSSGYYLNNSSRGFIAPGSGMRNGANRGAHISNGSTLAADGCVFTGFDQAGIHASRASTVQCADADLSGNSQDPANTFGALYASRNSRIHGPNIDLTNSGGDGVRVQRLASIVVPDIDVSGCAGIAFVANGGDIMSDSGSPVTNGMHGQLINAANNGRIYLGGVNATFVAGMTDFAIECRQGIVYVRDLTMSGQEGICIYAIGAGAKVDCPAYTVTSGQDAVNCLDLAEVNIERCNITGQTRYGVSAASGAKVTVEDGTVSGSVNNDLNCVKGAQIFAFNATTSSGAVNVADTNFSNFNTIEGNKGIIWA